MTTSNGSRRRAGRNPRRSLTPRRRHASRAGASGYIHVAIERVALGRIYCSEAVADPLANEIVRGCDAAWPHERLSTREFEVFHLIAMGRNLTDIGQTLNVSVKTVSAYRARILEKMGSRSNADIVTYAVHNQLID